MKRAASMLLGLACVAPLWTACGSDDVRSDPATDAGAEPDATTEAGADASGTDSGTGGASALDSFYAAAQTEALPEGQPIVVDDGLTEVSGRWVRAITYGFVRSGFPSADSSYDAGAQLFFETDSAGAALQSFERIALSLRRIPGDSPDPDGMSVQCTLRTGVPCAVAAQNVAAPGRFSTPYPNEYAGGAAVTDSTVLQLNLLAEQALGTDAEGQPLPDPAVLREYVAEIAAGGMMLITATQRIVVSEGLASAPPSAFAVTGHSKWGGAAAQLIAHDPRVVGGLVAGWPLDWQNWLDLAQTRYVESLGVEPFDYLCAEPCAYRSNRDFRDYFAGPAGVLWKQQFDVSSIAARLAGKRWAAIRNGNENHPADTESTFVESTTGPAAFLFLPNQPHTFDTQAHSSFWRHWVRHTLADARAPNLSTEIIRAEDALTASVTLTDATLVSAELLYRTSTDGTFGSMDAVPAYQTICQGQGSCRQWQTAALDVTGADATTSMPVVVDSEPVATLVRVTFDDGSGDLTDVTSSVQVHP